MGQFFPENFSGQEPRPAKARKRLLWVALAMVGSVLLCCLGLTILRASPYGLCLDFVSGHAPKEALDRFMDRVIQATRDEEYDWLATVTTPRGLEDLKKVRSLMVGGYTLHYVDDLGGRYEYTVVLDTGKTLYAGLWSVWPQCPDFDITDEEVFANIVLEQIDD